MPTKRELWHEFEHEIQFYSTHTQKQYRAHLFDYLEFAGAVDWENRETLYKYVDILRAKKKLSQQTINYIVRGPIGALFRAYGYRIPVKLPRVSPSMIDLSTRVAFTADEITRLITVARDSDDEQWQNMMALSTIYGLRAGEIRAVKMEDAHPVKKTVVVHTLKGGMKREHLVPTEISPYIFGYDYPAVSASQMYVIFREVADAAGVNSGGRKCFHAVRHGVVTQMEGERKVAQTRIYQFFRWSGGGIMNIYVTPRMFDVDEEIFAAHPFLKLWVK